MPPSNLVSEDPNWGLVHLLHHSPLLGVFPTIPFSFTSNHGFSSGARTWVLFGTYYPLVLENEMAAHSSTLAWKIPWTEEPGRLQSTGSQSRTRLSDFTLFLSYPLILPSDTIELSTSSSWLWSTGPDLSLSSHTSKKTASCLPLLTALLLWICLFLHTNKALWNP